MDFFDLFENAFAWVFVVFAFLWGVTGFIQEWDEFGQKLVNSILIVGSIVFFILLWSSNDFIEASGVLVCGAAALWIGTGVGDAIDDDWKGIAAIFGIIAFIAMFVLFGIYV